MKSAIVAASAMTMASAHSVRHGRYLGKSSKSSPPNWGSDDWGDDVAYAWVEGSSSADSHWSGSYWGDSLTDSHWSGSYWGDSSADNHWSGSYWGSFSSSKSGKSSGYNGKSGKSSFKSDEESDNEDYSPVGIALEDDAGALGNYGEDDDSDEEEHHSNDDNAGDLDEDDSGALDDDGKSDYSGDEHYINDDNAESLNADSEDDGSDVSEGYSNNDDAGAWDDGKVFVSDDNEGYPNDVCFSNGNVVTCEGAPEGEAVHVKFSYSVETIEVDAEDIVSSLESAILDATVDYVLSQGSSYHGITRLSSSPEDYISDGVFCPPYDCSIIMGEMTVYADSHAIDACDHLSVLQASMDNADFSEIEGVQQVEYLHSGKSCVSASRMISGEAIVTDDGLSTGTMIALAMLAALVVSVANKFLLDRKLRQERDAGDSDYDLISNYEEGNESKNNDHIASTVDVHKCTSLNCNCNKEGAGTTFLPVTADQGLDTTLPTVFGDEEEIDTDDSLSSRNSSKHKDTMNTTLLTVSDDEEEMYTEFSPKPKDTIIHAASHLTEDRELTPVREIA